MEPTIISSPQGTQSAHAARHRSTAQTPDANEPGSGGFLALLAALGDGAMGGGDGAPLDLAASGAAPSDVALSDAAKAAMEASAMAAWQGLLVPGANVRVDAAAAERGQGGSILSAGAQTGAGLGLEAQGGSAQGGLASLAGILPGTDGLSQGIEVDVAGPHYGGGISVVDQSEQQVLQRRIFMVTLVGVGQGLMQRFFEAG